MIECRDVSVAYEGTTPIRHLNLLVNPGATAIMGPSGSGKSTLLRLIAGLQSPTSGEVLIGGRHVEVATWNRSSDLRVSSVYQDYRLVSFLTVRENVELAAEVRGLARPSGGEIVHALGRVRLDPELLDRMPRTLSGGQQQRVAIARALLSHSQVIVADEPTGALDTGNTLRVGELLAQLGSEGQTIVVATHDERVAALMGATVQLDDIASSP